jgi:hypothetical protein
MMGVGAWYLADFVHLADFEDESKATGDLGGAGRGAAQQTKNIKYNSRMGRSSSS